MIFLPVSCIWQEILESLIVCGIVGQFKFNSQKVHKGSIENMMDSIIHRGPDDSGLFMNGHVGIGFRRLSIIDTAGGHQPIYNEDENIVLVSNGEIYNYHELKEKMIAKGHRFKTKSDVEVILHLYEEFDLDFVEHLNGMFAICLYDIRKDLMILARDRIGIKPLYLLKNKNGVYFSSEIKGILASGEVEIAEEESAFEEYLMFRFLSNNRTFFSHVKALEPGELYIVDHGLLKIKRYVTDQTQFLDMDNKHLTETIFLTLDNSVKRQLMSDVPLGTLLSGGVDSSFVTALAAKEYPGLKSFTVGFEEQDYDESSYAKIVSDKFGTEYHMISIGNKEFSDHLPKSIWFYDEPLNHANSVQIFLISKYARNFVKVLLTGEGADELFGGYPRYQINKIACFLSFLGQKNARLIMSALTFFDFRRIKKLACLLSYSLDDMIIMNSAFIQNSELNDLLLTRNGGISERKKVLQRVMDCSDEYLNRLLLFEQRTYLQSVLTRADKMSMAASIEARVPFLDNEMLGLANSIRGRTKLQKLKSKFLLKESAVRVLPEKIVNRAKVGFGSPLASWMRDPSGLGRFLDQIVEDKEIRRRISNDKLRQIVSEHKSSIKNHADILWPLVNYSLWRNQFLNA